MLIVKGLLIKSQYMSDLRITIGHHHRNHFPIMGFLLMLREVKKGGGKKKEEQEHMHSCYKAGPVVDNLFVLHQKMISKKYSPINMFMRVIVDWG